MSTNITGPRALGGFKPETMQSAEGRAAQVQALCRAVARSFEARGRVDLLSWIWVQQNPDGAFTPAILAVEAAPAHADAFEARVTKACGLGKALAVATVTEQQSVQVLFEWYDGSELYGAPIRAGSDPLNPSATRRVLEPFGQVTVDRARFLHLLHEPLRS